jgi:hypothetical protein
MVQKVTALLASPIAVRPRSNTVERAAEFYGRWRSQLEPDYAPDWSGLRALLDQGLSQ